MPLALYTCLLWLSTSGFWTIQAENTNTNVSMRSHHRGLAPTNVDFAFSLYKYLVASAPEKNIFISPVSISMALAMLSLGTYGHTRTQLLQGLGFNLTETSEVEIHQSFRHLHHLLRESATSLEMTMGNALFLDHSLELLETFSADIKRYYDSEALATDFQDWARASRQINEYVKNKTQGKIFNLLSDLDSPAVLILINYIFFKGTWAQPFDPESTREENFYVNDTTVVKVPMMFQSSTISSLRDSELPCQLVQLNYVGNGTVFFILPDEGEMDTVITALSRDTIQRWSKSLTIGQVDLYIPKVSISGAHDLQGVLADMGISDLFTNQANFSGISQEAQVKVSKVVHKAVLQLNERGVQAAASAGVTLNLTSEPLTISFNKPFLILVFDHFTWSSLFLGKVVNPT
ncbi:corticosteroid-binding globulin precursor [Daubentonia madagascariensis]|uniref:Corticosteroid-binding globulin n=1 Tax=Daubentonia madagascariensis TaxID=31869 RepID=A0ABD2ETC2_DAUMA